MDPDACLAEIRAELIVYNTATDREAIDVAAGAIVELVEALDEWLGSGGYLPAAWTDKRKQRLRSRP